MLLLKQLNCFPVKKHRWIVSSFKPDQLRFVDFFVSKKTKALNRRKKILVKKSFQSSSSKNRRQRRRRRRRRRQRRQRRRRRRHRQRRRRRSERRQRAIRSTWSEVGRGCCCFFWLPWLWFLEDITTSAKNPDRWESKGMLGDLCTQTRA